MSEAQVSFAEVEDSNSAGLALMLEMTRCMQKDEKRISFTGLPEQMLIVARAYGIDEELAAVLNS
jgi:ABC-type transporter Mla MlaB component